MTHHRTLSLLSDAERREDPAQQIVGRELAGDLCEILLCEPQLFGHEFACTTIRELARCLSYMCVCTIECIEMTAASGDHAGVRTLVANAGLEVFAQQVDALACCCGEVHARWFRLQQPRGAPCRVDLVEDPGHRHAAG